MIHGEHNGSQFEVGYRSVAWESGKQEVIALCIGPLFVCQEQSGEWRVSLAANGWQVCPGFQFWDDALLMAFKVHGEDWSPVSGETPSRSFEPLGERVRVAYFQVMLYSEWNMQNPDEVPS